jgi:CheY-like chemotaxis protein
MRRDSPTETILLVDDNLDIRELAKSFLEIAGYTVATAADGEEGLRFCEEHRSSIGLLLTDVEMPNLNGLELADRVLEIDSELPVLFMSGESWGASRSLECVAKPIRPADLVERVSRALKASARSVATVPAA